MTSVLGTIVSFALLFLGPAAVVGAITSGVVRTSAGRRDLTPVEVSHKAMVGFWIGAIVALALELVLFGLCVSALSNIG